MLLIDSKGSYTILLLILFMFIFYYLCLHYRTVQILFWYVKLNIRPEVYIIILDIYFKDLILIFSDKNV